MFNVARSLRRSGVRTVDMLLRSMSRLVMQNFDTGRPSGVTLRCECVRSKFVHQVSGIPCSHTYRRQRGIPVVILVSLHHKGRSFRYGCLLPRDFICAHAVNDTQVVLPVGHRRPSVQEEPAAQLVLPGTSEACVWRNFRAQIPRQRHSRKHHR